MAAALAAVILWIAGCQMLATDGPLMTGQDRTTSYGSWDVGSVLSFGSSKIRNPTDSPIRLVDVIADPPDGLVVKAIYVVDLTDVQETSGLATGFPPPNQAGDTFTPVDGATLRANTWYQVMFMVEVVKQGRWTMPSYDLVYETEGREYRATAPHGLRVCSPQPTDCA
ncbi:hypothetical protein QEZ54_01905 [Catellatospora sp. KI3]|uniref:hypothetical protein n=1 Tax=Catellatospora sp. KI3 TaxID=3041620 RepID=UPI002482E3C2|nr:hypothetical protein [Catellatospora sp. KI3]MDI1459712.1 hypothetical protein [Catellatospora sp. KI3]